MLILPADADESVVSTAVDRIAKSLSTSGGETTKVDRWGRRRFAYEINKQTEGYYVVVSLRAEPTAQVDLERVLTLADEVIRFKVTVRPPAKASKRKDRSAETPRKADAPPSSTEAPAPPAEASTPAADPSEPHEDQQEQEASPAPA
jgi:small subunit ribosomal protein S6